MQRDVDQLIAERFQAAQAAAQYFADVSKPGSPSKSEVSTTATFNVCWWTLGVSLYNNNASQPLSRFIAHRGPQELPRWCSVRLDSFRSRDVDYWGRGR